MLHLIGKAATVAVSAGVLATGVPAIAGASTYTPTVVAHRGGDALRPEETMAAYRYAYALGADVIESDIHVLKNGMDILAHDDTPARTCDGPGQYTPWQYLTWSQVSKLDCGERQRHPAPYQPVPGAKVPALYQVINLLKQNPSKRFTLEIKSDPTTPLATIKKETSTLAYRLHNAGVASQVTIHSFDLRPLVDVPCVKRFGIRREWIVSAKHLEIGEPGTSPWLMGYNVDSFAQSWAGLVNAVHNRWGVEAFDIEYTLVSKYRLSRIEPGISVGVWGPYKLSSLPYWRNLGVNFVASDRPDLAVKIMEQ